MRSPLSDEEVELEKQQHSQAPLAPAALQRKQANEERSAGLMNGKFSRQDDTEEGDDRIPVGLDIQTQS